MMGRINHQLASGNDKHFVGNLVHDDLTSCPPDNSVHSRSKNNVVYSSPSEAKANAIAKS